MPLSASVEISRSFEGMADKLLQVSPRPHVKANFSFWRIVLVGIALALLGYFGFIASMPDKTSGSLIPVFFVCLLMLMSGVVVLVGAAIYAVAKIATDRKRSKKVDV